MGINVNELALLCKQDSSYLTELWLSVFKLIVYWARRYIKEGGSNSRYDLDDLTQSAYPALLRAVDDYTEDCGYQFTTFLGNRCKTEFATVIGVRTSRREPPLLSLDVPIGENIDITLGDTITDETAAAGIDSVIDDVYNNQLRAALDEALNTLPELNREVIESRFYNSLNLTQTAAVLCLSSYDMARRLEYQALRALRRGKAYAILKSFDYYGYGLKRTGFSYFRDNMESSVEAAVLRREEYIEQYLKEIECKK